MRRRFDPLALLASVTAAGMAVVYVVVIRDQADRPAMWFLAALVLGAALAGYAVPTRAAHRRECLLVSGIVLFVMGILALLTIGLPIVGAGVLSLMAFERHPRRVPQPRPPAM